MMDALAVRHRSCAAGTGCAGPASGCCGPLPWPAKILKRSALRKLFMNILDLDKRAWLRC